MHHICPVPHLPCTTLACTIFALLSQDSQLKGTSYKKQQREQAFLDAKCFEEINNKMVVEC